MTDISEFSKALDAFQIEIPAEQQTQLAAYAELLWEWNSKINLTRHTTWQLFASRDILDVVHLANLIESQEEVLDWGSGGGVPGIPLAILCPDLQVSLVESVGKKAQVLNDIVAELNLPITVYATRGEDLLEDLRFDTVVVRAVGSLRKMCTWVAPHWPSIGRILAIKGPRWVDERGEARHHGVLKGVEMRKVAGYPMAESENEGVILQLWRKGDPRFTDGEAP